VNKLKKKYLKASIIIITYNGSEKITRLLNSICLIEERDFEVIIVNDGSTDNTVDVIKGLRLNFEFQIISQENKGRASAKNYGASIAVSPVLWFIDDDMRVLPGSLAAHLQHHKDVPGSVSVGSTIEDEELLKTDIQKYKCYISNNWKEDIESMANPMGVDDLYLSSANVSMPASVFNTLGGFDERLLDAEDLDLSYRAWLSGIPVYYNHKAEGYHMDLITCRSYILRNRQYMQAYNLLRKLKPQYGKINDRLFIKEPSGYKRMLLSLIAQPAFVKCVDGFNIFRLMPARIRFRFYELLIYGLGQVFTSRKI